MNRMFLAALSPGISAVGRAEPLPEFVQVHP